MAVDIDTVTSMPMDIEDEDSKMTAPMEIQKESTRKTKKYRYKAKKKWNKLQKQKKKDTTKRNQYIIGNMETLSCTNFTSTFNMIFKFEIV